jgi:hypothetical protein
MLEEALVNTLSIKVNGLACLGCSYSSFVPEPLDTFRQKDIIAILWTDLVVTGNNKMYYIQFERTFSRTKDRKLLYILEN